MIDNVTMAIEQIKLKITDSTTPYKDAFFVFMSKHEDIYKDPEDLLEVISPILLERIKLEFENSKVFGKDSPYYKKNSNLEEFF